MPQIAPSESFYHSQGLGLRVPVIVEPSSIVEASGIHHEGIPVPSADGVSHPFRIRILRKFAAVRVNRTEKILITVIENYDDSRSLHDLGKSRWKRIQGQQARGQTTPRWSIFPQTQEPLLIDGLRPRLYVFRFEVLRNIARDASERT